MNQLMVTQAARFAESHPDAHTIHVRAHGADSRVLDVAEFRRDWGEGRAHGVFDWLQDVAGTERVYVSAMRPTGVRRGPDEEHEVLAEALFPQRV